MFVVKHKAFFFIFSGITVILSVWAIFGWGLKFGIEYTGGTIAQYEFANRPSTETIRTTLAPLSLGEFTVQETGTTGVVLKTRFLSEAEHASMQALLSRTGTTSEKSFRTIGPVIGEELKRKAWIAIGLVILCIVLFITFAFRKVSKPVASWKYGVVAIVALVHDILIPSGVFAVLTHYAGAEIDILYTTALLAILGLSINDTIVVFDRIRENLRRVGDTRSKESFEETVGQSLSETYLRSFNTSFTVILALLALYFVGGESTQNFSLTLLVGMIAGTYSSIFLASPMLVVLNNWQKK